MKTEKEHADKAGLQSTDLRRQDSPTFEIRRKDGE